jgi:hypothetical protein
MNRILVRDINVGTEETVGAWLIELDKDGNVLLKTELSEEELSRELDNDNWGNPHPQWVGKDLQRLTHRLKI